MINVRLVQIGQYILAIALISMSSFSFACQVNETTESARFVGDYLVLDGHVADVVRDGDLKVVLKREEGNFLL
ncbi:hypothetical protein A6E01_19675 (plasmid) [Vibrio breoganii]|uniref:DUF5666 domain-containing protein n=1 Tax=Vibrio breoganii TaxID=553239 RepID=A0AAN1CUA8_9VIBR|nr:hypothetical protein [Vibrio breoganii]ANO35435.1 hypothetical protein A6E01_19675 [Vibrio breoganii]PML13962.1 hypothetical protein BCT84_12440 [Vibrio breoganii]